jgi:hypothetical protein
MSTDLPCGLLGIAYAYSTALMQHSVTQPFNQILTSQLMTSGCGVEQQIDINGCTGVSAIVKV